MNFATFTSIRQDLSSARRRIISHPGFSIAAVLMLAIAVGGTASVFSITNNLLRPSLDLADQNDIYALTFADSTTEWGTVFRYGDFEVLGREAGRMRLAAYTARTVSLRIGTSVDAVRAEFVSAEYFDLLGLETAFGRYPGSADQKTVVLSYDLWASDFASDPSVLGTTVAVNREPHMIIGVARRGFNGVAFRFAPSLWVPTESLRQGISGDFRDEPVSVIARLEQATSPSAATMHLAEVIRSIDDQKGVPTRSAKLTPIALAASPPWERRALRMVGALLILLAGLVLVGACANVANMQLADAVARRGETALRAALGASRWRLIRQSLVESCAIALLAATGGLIFTWIFMQLIPYTLPNTGFALSLQLELHTPTILFALLLALVTTVLVGVAPSLRSGTPQAELLSSGNRGLGNRHGKRMGNMLVVAQVGFSMIVLVLSLTLALTVREWQRVDPGIQTSGTLTFGIALEQAGYDEARGKAVQTELLGGLGRNPQVQVAALMSPVPFMATRSQEVTTASGAAVTVYPITVSPGYFAAMGMAIRNGRTFSDFEGKQQVAVIPQSIARKLWPGEPALDRMLESDGGESYRVVGVVSDASYGLSRGGSMPFLYRSSDQHYAPDATVLVRSDANRGSLARTVRAELRAIDHDLPPSSFSSIAEMLYRLRYLPRSLAVLGSAFGLITAIVTAIGIYARFTSLVAQELPEHGVRLAIGATPSRLMWAVVLNGLRISGLGILLGGVGGLAGARVLTSLVPAVSMPGTLVALAIAAGIATVSVVATWFPARRAAAADPVTAIRGA